MNPHTALNDAGDTLKALDMGAVRLRYRPADDLITRDTFVLWIEAEDDSADAIGTGDTPAQAYDDAMAQAIRKAA